MSKDVDSVIKDLNEYFNYKVIDLDQEEYREVLKNFISDLQLRLEGID